MGLRSRLRDLGKSAAQHEADEVRARSVSTGCRSVERLRPREHAVVAGTVKALTLPPIRSVPALVAEVYDGTGTVHLIFMGRRRIAGIEPGSFVRAEGRVTAVRGTPAIFNPAYQIVPR